jgi:2-polyprenyl-6-hydroxyphenyl methylase/3-demethylubiquinone-9 3-methyltransferase
VLYIRDAASFAFARDPEEQDVLRGLRILDIGCGAGILCEPLAQLGASVVGIDLAENTLERAASHARQSGIDLQYRATSAEALVEAGECFDVVLAMEVIEHVADYRLFLRTCAQLTGSHGVIVLSTINRTFKSWLQAIFIGEYVLRLLPRGAHQWGRFIKPMEIQIELERYGMLVTDVSGVTMKLATRELQLSSRMGVNYILAARRLSD